MIHHQFTNTKTREATRFNSSSSAQYDSEGRGTDGNKQETRRRSRRTKTTGSWQVFLV